MSEWEPDEEWFEYDPIDVEKPPAPSLHETENPTVARILGPRGQVISECSERATVSFGYSKRRKVPTRIKRTPR